MHLSPLERDILIETSAWRTLAELQADLDWQYPAGEVQDTIESMEEHELLQTIPYAHGSFIVHRTPLGGSTLFRELVHS